MPCKCAAARSISRCLYCPARLSAESTASGEPSRNIHKEICIFLWYFYALRRRFLGATPVLGETARVDEVVFLLSGWLMLTPRVSFVDHDFSFADKFFGMPECRPVQFHCHG